MLFADGNNPFGACGGTYEKLQDRFRGHMSFSFKKHAARLRHSAYFLKPKAICPQGTGPSTLECPQGSGSQTRRDRQKIRRRRYLRDRGNDKYRSVSIFWGHFGQQAHVSPKVISRETRDALNLLLLYFHP